MRPAAAVLAGSLATIALLAPPAAANPIKDPPWPGLQETVNEIFESRPGDVYCVWSRDVSTDQPTSVVCVPAPDDPAIPEIGSDD